jgi:hypothetical protein
MPELLTDCVGLHFRPSEVKTFVNEEVGPGYPVTLEREPDNQYDANAIKVLADDQHIGYVPKTSNTVLAMLMDQDDLPNLRAQVHSFVGRNPQILIEWD